MNNELGIMETKKARQFRILRNSGCYIAIVPLLIFLLMAILSTTLPFSENNAMNIDELLLLVTIIGIFLTSIGSIGYFFTK